VITYLICIVVFIGIVLWLRQEFDGWFDNTLLFWGFLFLLGVIMLFGGWVLLLILLSGAIVIGAAVASFFGSGG